MLGWTQTPVYAPALWVWIADEAAHPLALGIADADRDLGEGILEWVQVHPAARSRGLGMALVSELLRRMQQLHLSYATVSGDADNPDKPETLYRRCRFAGEDVWVVGRSKE